MKKSPLLVLALSLAVLGSGCVAFDVGEPEKWSLDRGDEGSVVVTRQKKMSFGLFPAQAEWFHRPPESVEPLIGWTHAGNGQYVRDNREPVARYFFGVVTTPWSLLVTPWHGTWECSSHHWKWHDVALIGLFPQETQKEIAVKSAVTDREAYSQINTSSISHSSWFGFHRYATVVVEERDAEGHDEDAED